MQPISLKGAEGSVSPPPGPQERRAPARSPLPLGARASGRESFTVGPVHRQLGSYIGFLENSGSMKTSMESALFRTAGTPASTMNPDEHEISQKKLTAVDIIVMVLYFIFVLMVGVWAMYTTKRSTVKGYFLAGRNMTWCPIGASLFSSNIGSGHFIGLAGSGASSGIAVSVYEWSVTTMPEYLRKRFGSQRIHFLIATLSLFAYIFTKISVDIYAGGIFIHLALHWDLYIAVIGLLFITAIYTVGGGLAAVMYTDALQTAIMLVGSLILMIFAFVEVGGYSGLENKYFSAIPNVFDFNSTCGMPRDDAFHIFQDPVNSDFPWTGVIFGVTILSIWYWCTDQVIVQRTLSAKSIIHSKSGCLFAAYLKILPIFIMVFPGMISRVLFPNKLQFKPEKSVRIKTSQMLEIQNENCKCQKHSVRQHPWGEKHSNNRVACTDEDTCLRVCGNPAGCTDIAYPLLVMELLPGGLKGLMIAVMIAVLMSSLTSIFNSSSTLFTMDIWRHLRPHCSEWELMVVGRIFVLILVVVSVLWIPLVQVSQGGKLFIYIQSVTSYLTPPIAVVFVVGCFWKRANEKGAFWSLAAGFLVGFIRMVLDFVYITPKCGQPDTRPLVTRRVHFLHFALILCFITLIMVVIISLLSSPPHPEQIRRLTWYTRFEDLPEKAPEETVVIVQNKPQLPEETRNASGTEEASLRGEYYEALFHKLHTQYQEMPVMGLLLMYSNHYIHLLESSIDLLYAVIHHLANPLAEERLAELDMKILVLSHNIPDRLFRQWLQRPVNMPVTLLMDTSEMEPVERLVPECLTLLLKLGNFILQNPKKSITKPNLSVSDEVRHLIIKENTIKHLCDTSELLTPRRFLQHYEKPTHVVLDSEVVWPTPLHLFLGG
ncbi:sodium/myo-inositol cotransporter 2-like isoform X3 [Narcine bancroftii]|uniref:sodium/myo-inositol cotransporter 2-like isoform X3 n=1 Tax=Narcine bancroftii TaxID=1343680 RepID=UPI0038315969